MCGIAGFIGFGRDAAISKEEIWAMTQRLAHRGPNDAGCVLIDGLRTAAFRDVMEKTPFSRAGVALGNRRLSILDLSDRGHQPMSSPDGRVWMSYNGEVYNYVELKKELEAKGHLFFSTSDTEVVLHAYLEWGADCFTRFNGMWGVALYDLRSQELILSRDRLGKKPLYYYRAASGLFFASEIKALLTHPAVPREMNLRKVAAYAGLHYRYVDDDEDSFFRDIQQVPKSSVMTVDRNGKVRVRRYWTLAGLEPLPEQADEGALIEEYRDLLTDAVKLRLRSDVPVGIMMSGGLDSTSIACLAAPRNPTLVAFSGVTGEGYYDESEFMKEVIQKTGIRSVFVYPKPAPLLETLREMMARHDEPVCTVTWYSLYLITREIARHQIPVILTGHGGDELLAGYWDHYHYRFADLRSSGRGDAEERRAWQENHGRDPAEYDREKGYIERLRQDRSVELERFSRYLPLLSPTARAAARKAVPDCPLNGELTRRLYLEIMYETIPPSLRAEDRNTMAHSIENRVPFLDYRLIEFCFRLDNRFKIRGGLGKWIHREAMKGILPEKVRTRKEKVGFNAPADEWFRNELRKDIEEMIDRPSPINDQVYDRSAVRRCFDEHVAGANHAMFFWQFINLHVWYEMFFHAPAGVESGIR